MSENVKHIFKSAEKELVMSAVEVHEFVKQQIIPPAQENTRNSLQLLSSDPVGYLRNLREELVIELKESEEEIDLINIVTQDLEDCANLLDRYEIAISEESLLSKYLIQGLNSSDGEIALFSLLKEAGFTFEEVAKMFSDKIGDTSVRKMEKTVSLSRLASVYQ